MIELNLLPQELRRKKKRPVSGKKQVEISSIPYVPICVGVLLFLVLVHVSLLVIGGTKKSATVQLEKKWDQMLPQRKKTDAIAKETNALKRRVKAIREITKPDLDWAGLLTGLNRAVISNIWLSEFHIKNDQKGGALLGGVPVSLDISGYALGSSEVATATVGRFMESLKDDDDFFRYFDEIELESIRNASLSGEEVMVFKLLCRFKRIKPMNVKKTVKARPKRRKRR